MLSSNNNINNNEGRDRVATLSGKKYFITGAASGIGKAVAIAAAKQGAHLFVTDINTTALDEVVANIQQDGGTVLAWQAFDIADYDSVKTFCDNITAQHGSCDVIMNIAGIAIWGDITKLQHEHWKQVIDINLMGPIHVMECLVPPMVEAGKGGSIVNVASAAGLFALPWHAAYSASKFGLRGLSEVLRFDLKRHNIHVHVVCPGAVNTGLVGTVKIVGIDQSDPEVIAMRKQFQRHAVSPEVAASAILKGIRHNQFIIYTSSDIRLGYWFKQKFAPPFNLVIGHITDRMMKLADKQWNK